MSQTNNTTVAPREHGTAAVLEALAALSEGKTLEDPAYKHDFNLQRTFPGKRTHGWSVTTYHYDRDDPFPGKSGSGRTQMIPFQEIYRSDVRRWVPDFGTAFDSFTEARYKPGTSAGAPTLDDVRDYAVRVAGVTEPWLVKVKEGEDLSEGLPPGVPIEDAARMVNGELISPKTQVPPDVHAILSIKLMDNMAAHPDYDYLEFREQLADSPGSELFEEDTVYTAKL